MSMKHLIIGVFALMLASTCLSASMIQIRRDTNANWASANPILAQGEMGYEIDTFGLKFGTGTDNWNDLNYYSTSANLSNYLLKADFNSNLTPQTCPAGQALRVLGASPTCIAVGGASGIDTNYETAGATFDVYWLSLLDTQDLNNSLEYLKNVDLNDYITIAQADVNYWAKSTNLVSKSQLDGNLALYQLRDNFVNKTQLDGNLSAYLSLANYKDSFDRNWISNNNIFFDQNWIRNFNLYKDSNFQVKLAANLPLADGNITSISWSKVTGIPNLVNKTQLDGNLSSYLSLANYIPYFDQNFIRNNALYFDSNFERKLKASLPLADGNISSSAAWNAKLSWSDFFSQYNDAKYDANWIRNYNAYKDSNFQTKLAANFPIADGNLARSAAYLLDTNNQTVGWQDSAGKWMVNIDANSKNIIDVNSISISGTNASGIDDNGTCLRLRSGASTVYVGC